MALLGSCRALICGGSWPFAEATSRSCLASASMLCREHIVQQQSIKTMERTLGLQVGKYLGSTPLKSGLYEARQRQQIFKLNLNIRCGGGQRLRKPRIWKTRQRRGTISKSQKLLECIRPLSNVKEELYGALDTFIAWEIDFPLIAVKKALHTLEIEKDWKRIIQVTKWMLGKGQGKTLGTYLLLLEALDLEGRVEEAQEIWAKIFKANMESTPRRFYLVVMRMYERHGMPEELLDVFADMEELDIWLDRESVGIVVRTYEKIGIYDKAEKVRVKYATRGSRYRMVNGKKVRMSSSRYQKPNDQNSSLKWYRRPDETITDHESHVSANTGNL